MTIKIRPGD